MVRPSRTTTIRSLLLGLLGVSVWNHNGESPISVEAFSGMSMSSSSSSPKTIYGVPNSGWTAPGWNWGYAVGTGHDCAAICRRKYSSRDERLKLIGDLLGGSSAATDLEEVKLVLALKWQRNYRSGYGDVLDTMAEARRYEEGPSANALLLADMRDRFDRLNPTPEDRASMDALATDDSDDVDGALRRCSGLVLKAMGFADGW